MNPKTLLIAGGVLAVAAFLLGFVPQYGKARDLDAQLSAARQELGMERDRSQMDALSLLIGRVYLETSQKNYGIAGQVATQFFDRARAMTGTDTDAKRKAFSLEALAARDAVIGGLAKGDPGTLVAVQTLFQHALDVAQQGSR